MPPARKFAIVADDLTGAMDTAAPFAARGAVTRVFLSLPQGAVSEPAQVVSFTTDSRHLDARQAYDRVAAGVAALCHEPRLLFKKIDSTLRGNVAVETLAALAASGRRHALVCPAFPAQGRTLVASEVFVHGVPLRETAIGRDALSPPPTGRLDAVFRDAAGDWRVHAVAQGQGFTPASAPGLHVYVIDAVTHADLVRVAERALAIADDVVLVGSSGLGHALAEVGVEQRSVAPRPPIGRPLLCVVGSRTPQSTRQAQRLIDAGATRLDARVQGGRLALPDMPSDAALRGPALLLGVEQVDPTPLEADQVAAALGEFAAELIRTRRFSAVIATGGDTARALLRALGVCAIDLLGELLPGIALGSIAHAGNVLPIVTKAGGFGDDDLFVDIVQRLTSP